LKKRQKTITARYLSELLNKKIVTSDGKTVGHVFDIELSQDGTFRVTALMYGKKALLYRLHILEPLASAFDLNHKPQTIPWQAIDKVDHAVVCLKAGYEIEQGSR
jgi:sporulation protein YlmC with PRC-barrel domain